ncbi:MAG: hypothetical protein GYB67_01855 [Chloroflexi bacterium]|nr:hypothetical protein [Chloroflexota bacterium]
MTTTFKRIIYGPPTANDQTAGNLKVLAQSDQDLTAQDAARWRGLTSVQPMSADTARASRAFGLFAGTAGAYILACAYLRNGDPNKPLYDYILVPRAELDSVAGNLQPLFELFGDPGLNGDSTHLKHIAPPEPPRLAAWTPAERRAQFETLLTTYAGGDITRVWRLLSAALHERGLMLYNYPAEAGARLALVEGLMSLLPASTRADLTFSTNRNERATTQSQIAFTDKHTSTRRWIVDWEAQTFPTEIPPSPYVERLQALWAGDIGALLAAINEMDVIAAQIDQAELDEKLAAVAERHMLDARVTADEDISDAELIKVLRADTLHGELKQLYAERLLQSALLTREPDAILTVAAAMDADPALDEALGQELTQALDHEPDGVYAFVRARLAQGFSETWLARLHAAALASLQVAITDSDADTLISWLRLISREPANYGLSDTLYNGIRAAQERARQDPELARGLVTLAAKRNKIALEDLLDDAALIAVLPDNLGAALSDHTGEPSELLHKHGPEIFLVALGRAAQAQRPELFTVDAVDQIWTLYTSGKVTNLPEEYDPENLVEEWLLTGAQWLSIPALETLLAAMLRDDYDDLFHRLVRQLAEATDRGTYLAVIAAALASSGRDVSGSLALVAQMIGAGDLNQQGAVNTYLALLDRRDWASSALPMMEQLARVLQQHPALEIETAAAWKLLEVAAAQQEEFIARAAARRLSAALEQMEDEELLVAGVRQLFDRLAWSQTTKQNLLGWWRGFVRAQSLGRLQRLDKALGDLDDLRTILQTVIAFRKMLGKRSLAEFAEDVSTAYTVLEALSESFDPQPRRTGSFDATTVRAEMDARTQDLSSDETKILANTLKELAQIIATMGDARSKKAGRLLRGEDVDRQLTTGEQRPHSAVDALKWLSGYLSGSHDSDTTAET